MLRSSPWMMLVVGAALVCVGSSTVQAQSTSGIGWFGQKKKSSIAPDLSASMPGSGGTAPAGSYGLKKKSPWKRFTSGVSSTFKRGAEATSDFFMPDTNPEADDPTSLSNTKSEASLDVYVATARLKATNGRTAEAEAIYRQVLEEEPEHLGALLGLARLLDHYGKTDEAIELYRQTAALHPKEASAHNDFGLCLGRHRRFEEAAKELELAVENQPDKELYRNNLAAVLVALGRKDEALKHMLAVHPPAVAHYNVGFLLGQSGDVRGGIEEIDLALQADPQMKEARQQRGLLLAKLPGPFGPHYLARQQQGQPQQTGPQHQMASRPNPFASSTVAGQPVTTAPMQNAPVAPTYSAPPTTAGVPTVPANGPQGLPAGTAFPPSRY